MKARRFDKTLAVIRGCQRKKNKCRNARTNILCIPLLHLHVSASYRSRISENFDTPRSEEYFVQATYVPRTCDVPATFMWRISGVSVFVLEFHFRMYGVSRRM